MSSIESDEFANLVNLADEFCDLDRSLFPFRGMDANEVRKTYGLYPHWFEGEIIRPDYRGNYVANHIYRQLKVQYKNSEPRFHDLTWMFDLPTELIYEIFERLHPFDLYTFIRTTKNIRAFLLSRRASGVWAGSFARHPDIPSCPSDVSYPKWVSLMFGPSRCDQCGRPGAMVDFTIYMHLCEPCMDGDTVFFRDELSSIFNAEETTDTLRTLLRGTYRTSSVIYPYPHDYQEAPQYLKSDVVERSLQMREHLDAIAASVPGAKERYEEFKLVTSRTIREHMKHAKASGIFFMSVYQAADNAYNHIMVDLIKRWKIALVKLGHDCRDVDCVEDRIRWMLDDDQVQRCNKRLVHRYIGWMEPFLNEEKARRLSYERAELVTKRKDLVPGFLKRYRSTVDAVNRQYLPDAERLSRLDSIHNFIRHNSEELGEFPTEAATAELDHFVKGWLATGKQRLCQILSRTRSSLELADEGALELATAVFSSDLLRQNDRMPESASALIGWADVGIHLSFLVDFAADLIKDEAEHLADLQFNERGYQAVQQILRLMKLDADRTRADAVDAQDERFTCMSCLFDGARSSVGRPIMTWRECISHYVQESDHHEWGPRFRIVPSDVTASVKFHEQPFPPPHEAAWSCLHCMEGADLKRLDAIEHVKAMHSIHRPVNNTDYMYCRHASNADRKPYFLGLRPPAYLRCNQCPDQRKLRLWTKTPLFSHLIDKYMFPQPLWIPPDVVWSRHNVQHPIEGEDWIVLDFASSLG